MSSARRVVESLLDDNEPVDPKEFVDQHVQPRDVVRSAYEAVLALPHDDKTSFYAEAGKIVNRMVDSLEKLTGRKATNGLHEILLAGAPKPWNYGGINKIGSIASI